MCIAIDVSAHFSRLYAVAARGVQATVEGTPALDASFKSRSVDQLVLSREQSEGVGARVRRSIGNPELRNFSPFLMLDEFKAGNKGGFPDRTPNTTQHAYVNATHSCTVIMHRCICT